jgi:hypothetical protein
VDGLVFPEVATIQLVRDSAPNAQPFDLAGVVFRVRLRARHKNDYTLAPFVSDEHGSVRIAAVACEALVAAAHDSGLMDYAGVEQCWPNVEIRPLSVAEIEQALEARRRVWQHLLHGEDRLFASMAELLSVYERAANARLSGPAVPLVVRWDGSEVRPMYRYPLSDLAPT